MAKKPKVPPKINDDPIDAEIASRNDSPTVNESVHLHRQKTENHPLQPVSQSVSQSLHRQEPGTSPRRRSQLAFFPPHRQDEVTIPLPPSPPPPPPPPPTELALDTYPKIGVNIIFGMLSVPGIIFLTKPVTPLWTVWVLFVGVCLSIFFQTLILNCVKKKGFCESLLDAFIVLVSVFFGGAILMGVVLLARLLPVWLVWLRIMIAIVGSIVVGFFAAWILIRMRWARLTIVMVILVCGIAIQNILIDITDIEPKCPSPAASPPIPSPSPSPSLAGSFQVFSRQNMNQHVVLQSRTHGYELLHQMEPFINQVLAYAQQSKECANYEMTSLNERMQEYQRQVDREARSSNGSSTGAVMQSAAKYSERNFVRKAIDSEHSQAVFQEMWENVRANDKKSVYRHIVCSEVDVNALRGHAVYTVSLPLAKMKKLEEKEETLKAKLKRIEEEFEDIPEGYSNSREDESSMVREETSNECALPHLARSSADIGMVELLLQYGVKNKCNRSDSTSSLYHQQELCNCKVATYEGRRSKCCG